MISHEYRCIFIHIPKCAGTSIETALGHLDGHEGEDGQDHRTMRMLLSPLTPHLLASGGNLWEAARGIRYRFMTHANPRNAVYVSPEQCRRYFKFTVVRNPWARAYSWYKNVVRDERHQRRHGIVGAMPSFKEFLRRFQDHPMMRSQTYWLQGFDGSIPMDYICRFERLPEDFAEVAKRLGLGNRTLPHELHGGPTDHRQHYDDESIERVARLYADDIALFKYRFDAPAGTGAAGRTRTGTV